MSDPAPPPHASSRYSRGAMALHWAIALLIMLEIGLGLRMEGPPGAITFAVYQLHKSIGITILALTLVRIGWRWTHRPPPPGDGPMWEKRLAHGVHLGFYAVLLAIPLSGWLIVSASRTGIDTVLFGLIPFPHIPGIPGLEPASKASVEEAAETAHRLLGYALYALLALHVLGALKHHLVDRDHGLARILPGPARVARLDLRLVAVVGTLAIMAAVAATWPWASQTRSPPEPVAPSGERIMTPAETPARQPGSEAAPPGLAPAPAETEMALASPGEPSGPVPASRWRVQNAGSRLAFSTTQSGAPIRGQFRSWTADIVFSPEALDQSRVRVVVDMGSFATDDSDSQGVLAGSEWFDVANHAQATFSATRFRRLGPDRYEARGSLRIKGVSRPATLQFTLTIEGDTARMAGTTRLDRTDFGVGTGEWAGTDDIPGAVQVETTVVAVRDTP
ncbi:cytochrome b/b6 domain-containing protein [Brevundimonas variabilis]|uniref:Cytochrome b561/polyisoprenoid-binding protein YceI n=1 Tax=Brevundimonas variabilis TaxID=74312 RepID=A0A7W9FF29_9CAUL|nr:cytochrome b/b6 domain-containing protein [Brevundimonas variabilis]MBB5744989.1 cytochrome b561/polyisoprenoid-binding protein YceI [Brevundimonas variabilis]